MAESKVYKQDSETKQENKGTCLQCVSSDFSKVLATI